MYVQVAEFSVFVSKWADASTTDFKHYEVYEDKSLFKAQGPVWHKLDRAKNEIPNGLRNVDKTAAWSKSGYHGWVYGYGLHLTCTHNGFPVLCAIEAANVNERKVLDVKKTQFMALGVQYIIADAGYISKQSTKTFATADMLLITPNITTDQLETMENLHHSFTDEQLDKKKLSRKTAIEPVFDLLRRLLATTGEHKQLPVRGIELVSTFLALGVLILQIAMLMNKMYGLPLRNVTHIKTVFQ